MRLLFLLNHCFSIVWYKTSLWSVLRPLLKNIYIYLSNRYYSKGKIRLPYKTNITNNSWQTFSKWLLYVTIKSLCTLFTKEDISKKQWINYGIRENRVWDLPNASWNRKLSFWSTRNPIKQKQLISSRFRDNQFQN